MDNQFSENALLARKVAAEGMVLLKNSAQALPLVPQNRIAIWGRGQFDFVKGGKGSADVKSAYTVNLHDGLQAKAAEGKLAIGNSVSEAYKQDKDFLPDAGFVANAAERCDLALVVVSRDSGEGCDRRAEPGDYYLTEAEEALLDLLEQSAFRNIVVVVNSGAIIDLRRMAKNERISGLLLASQPGMEGGNAVADILCGGVNPSGRLTDTYAGAYECYPSSGTFHKYKMIVPYEEDIFVGYRYFETVPGADKLVVYPFGFGLSYTDFSISDSGLSVKDDTIAVRCKVTNCGRMAGREVIQVYSKSPEGMLEKPALELRSYAKTRLLQPGESQALEMVFPLSRMAVFDDSGTTGNIGCWLLEQGVYRIHLGKNIRDLSIAGEVTVDTLRVTDRPGLRLTQMVSQRLNSRGEYAPTGAFDNTVSDKDARSVSSFTDGLGEEIALDRSKTGGSADAVYKLIDVDEGRCTMERFLDQLSKDELVGLCQAQPPAFPRGTAGVGNLRKFGIPNPQTADGPAGLRKSVPTTCFPCATLVACTWDEELQHEIGKALGYEGISTGVDILLAPGLNIHRDPLCGRNFEYYSEDPLISGKSAAAIVRGVQSEGLGATIKHFAANNREEERKEYNSVCSERALREIYLKGFEIAVKEGKPWCVMTSYNLLNGIKASCNRNLLTGILRGEWGFDGIVMTDWRNDSHLWQEILAGNDIKMPFGYPEELELAAGVVGWVLPLKVLRQSARRILELVMKTRHFKAQDFGISQTIKAQGLTHIKAIESTAISCTWTLCEECRDEDGGLNHSNLCKDQRGNDTYLIYAVNIEEAGNYDFSIRVATPYATSAIELVLNNDSLGRLAIPSTQKEDESAENAWQTWKTEGPLRIKLPACEHTLKVYVRDREPGQGININWLEFKRVQ